MTLSIRAKFLILHGYSKQKITEKQNYNNINVLENLKDISWEFYLLFGWAISLKCLVFYVSYQSKNDQTLT